VRFLLIYRLKEGATLRSAPLSTASTANLASFFLQNAASSLSMSSYVSETNVVAKVIDSTINRTPCIAQAKPVEINRTLPSMPGDYPLWPPWPVQDATDRKIRGYSARGQIEGGHLVDSVENSCTPLASSGR
jgi:hypothetical protein